MAVADATTPVKPAKSLCSIDEWEAKQTVGSTLLVLGVVTFGGFVPAIWARANHGIWYMNAWLRDAHNPYQLWIALHAVSAILLLALLFAQVATGLVDGEPTRPARRYHRFVGTWLLLPLVLACFGVALVAQVLEFLSTGLSAIFLNTVLTLVIVAEFGGGVYMAKKRRLAEHKDLMTWALIDCAIASGVSRVGMYLLQPLFRCDPFLSDAPIAFAAFTGTGVAALCLRANGRLARRFRTNALLLGLHLGVGALTTVTSILFECPEDRIVESVLR